MRKWLMVLGASFALTLAACGNEEVKTSSAKENEDSTSTTETSKLDEIKEKGKIVIGTGNYYPFEYLDPTTNELVGYDIDLGNKIGESLGVEVEWEDMQFQALIPSIQNDQIDLVIAAMYITDERKEVVDFADPYLETGMVLVKKKDDASVTTIEDLNGKKVGVKASATSEAAAKELQEKGYDIEIISYKDTTDYLKDLELGRVDVAINDYLNQLGYFDSYPESSLAITGETFTHSELGIAVAKGENDFIDAINAVLAEMKENGEKDALFEKWLAQ